ncbi:MAG: energy transducer TonB [Muribaculaceae bacterium]|nr:energy transducer TonB [Muribaculaceae bacterium]
MKHGRLICTLITVIGLVSVSAMAGNVSSNAMASSYNDVQSQVSDTTYQEEYFGQNPYRTPSFPGGDAELMRFISKNIEYPAEAVKNHIEGKVIVQLLVDKTGKVSEIKVVRSAGEDLDNEAVRVMKLLPDFSPGYNLIKGEPVSMWYTLPVVFKLQGQDVPEEAE